MARLLDNEINSRFYKGDTFLTADGYKNFIVDKRYISQKRLKKLYRTPSVVSCRMVLTETINVRFLKMDYLLAHIWNEQAEDYLPPEGVPAPPGFDWGCYW